MDHRPVCSKLDSPFFLLLQSLAPHGTAYEYESIVMFPHAFRRTRTCGDASESFVHSWNAHRLQSDIRIFMADHHKAPCCTLLSFLHRSIQNVGTHRINLRPVEVLKWFFVASARGWHPLRVLLFQVFLAEQGAWHGWRSYQKIKLSFAQILFKRFGKETVQCEFSPHVVLFLTKNIMLPFTYTRAIFSSTDSRTTSIDCWYVPGAEQRPERISILVSV